jgi:Zn-dependent protease with chaperone function
MGTRLKSILISAALIWTVGVLPVVSLAQTRIVAPKNKYKISDDIRLGNDAAREAERQFPILSDDAAQRYVESVGEKLVAAIPAQFQHPEFDYRFKVVNASDLNAFALPGGPMYVNRGMIQAAHNEGELAGVMAHEISHVALRHATAQATKQGSVGNTLGRLGMILAGAAVLGQTGAELGALGAQAWTTKYSREYEAQADTLGAQIMAAAGYDPRDLANVFQTIAAQGGSRGPQWLSDHPDPGNRYNKINQEVQYLKVSANPIKMTREFERVKSRLAGLPPARSMQQLQAEYERTGGRGNSGGGNLPSQNDPMTSGRYSQNIDLPSQRTRVYSNSGLSIRVPENWQDLTSGDVVSFAPQGAFGSQGITHGAMIGAVPGNSGSAAEATQSYVDSMLQSNTYLRQRGSIMQSSVAGRSGNVVQFNGRSEVTGETEIVTVYTTLLSNGVLVYVATVVPQNESNQYETAFQTMLNSLRINA